MAREERRREGARTVAQAPIAVVAFPLSEITVPRSWMVFCGVCTPAELPVRRCRCRTVPNRFIFPRCSLNLCSFLAGLLSTLHNPRARTVQCSACGGGRYGATVGGVALGVRRGPSPRLSDTRSPSEN